MTDRRLNTIGLFKAKLHKYITVQLFIALLLSIFSFRAMAQNEPYQNKKLIAVCAKSYPPYSFEGKDKQPIGFDVDIFKVIMKRLNLDYEIIIKSFGEAFDDVTLGKADILLGVDNVSRLDTAIRYITPSTFSHLDIITRSDYSVSSISEIQKKNIIIYNNGTFDNYSNSIQKNNHLDYFPNIYKGLQSIINSEKDVLICDHNVASYYIKALNITNINCKYADIQPTCHSMAVAKDNASLANVIDKEMERFKACEEYHNIQDNWLNSNDTHRSLAIYYIIVAIIATIAAIAFFLNFILRKKIRNFSKKNQWQLQQIALSLDAGNITTWGYNTLTKRFYNIHGQEFLRNIPIEDLRKYIPPTDFLKFEETINAISSGRIEKATITMQFLNEKTGKYDYIEKMIKAVKDEEGNITNIIGTHKDVSALIMKTEETETLLKKFQTVFNNASIGLEYYDKDGILIEVNDNSCLMYGIGNREEILERKISLKDNPNISEESVKRILDGERFNSVHSFDFDKVKLANYFHTSKTGVSTVESYIAPVLSAKGEYNGSIISSLDITQNHILNQSNQELMHEQQLILSTIPLGLIVYDRLGILKYSNDALKDVFGESTDSFISNCGNIFSSELIPQKIKDDIRAGKSGEEIIDIAKSKLKTDASYLSIRYSSIQDKDGNISNYIILVSDVSSLHKSQNELEEYKSRTNIISNDKTTSEWQYNNVTHEITLVDSGKTKVLHRDDLLKVVLNEDSKQLFDLIKTLDDGTAKEFSTTIRLHKSDTGEITYVKIMGNPIISETDSKVTTYI